MTRSGLAMEMMALYVWLGYGEQFEQQRLHTFASAAATAVILSMSYSITAAYKSGC